MLALLAIAAFARDLRVLHVAENADGDCLNTPCSFDTATNIVMNGDTIIFDDARVSITSYPSAMSDLLHTSMFMNVTFVAKDDSTVFDGRFMAGESLFNVHSASRFCWAKFQGFTFTNFEKPVMIRIMAETPWPLIIFKGCKFVENKQDIFSVKGGTFQFDNCVFRNNLHRPIKAVTEASIEMTDCVIERSESSFFFDCDVMIHNCRFVENFGSRGGALYMSKVTALVDGSKFVRNRANLSGGAVYIRESVADYECELRRSCFIDNKAGVNGTAFYGYWADTIIRDCCFSDEEERALFAFRSANQKSQNEFGSKCQKCLQYAPEPDDFDPIQANPDYDIDIEVGPNAWVEL